jgi:integrase
VAEKRQNGAYRANFTYTDPRTGTQQRCRLSLETRDVREARRREAELRVRLETPPKEEERKKAQKQASFSGFAHHWLEVHVLTNCKHSYYRSTEQACRVHLVPFFKDADVREIGVEQVETFKARMAKTHAPKTVNNLMGVLGTMFSSALTWGYAEENPVRRVRPLKLPPQEISFWEPPHSEAFLLKVRELRPSWYAFFLCALRTGLRAGELFALRWQDVDLVKGVIRVTWNYTHGRLGSPKSGRGRTVQMSPELRAALVAHRHLQGELVFPWNDGSYLNTNRVKHPFRTCTRAAGIPEIRLHDLRHTFASQLVMQGAPLRVVQELLGHADISMTMRYSHLGPNAAVAYVQALDSGSCPISAPTPSRGGGNGGRSQ